MNETEIIQNIMSYVVDASDYDRMQWSECSKVDKDTPYEDFLVWNETCINLLNNRERIWLLDLCRMLTQKSVNLMDMESCAVFTANAIYFGLDKKLCIVNPR
jgi:hypothetical protein